MTLGEAINARARAGARMVEARANYERIARTKLFLAIEAGAAALRKAEDEYAAAQATEDALYAEKKMADLRSAFDREADARDKQMDDLLERMIQLRIECALLERDFKRIEDTLRAVAQP